MLGNTTGKQEEPPLKCGFSVSARNFKKAVDRNRIKRITKEAYRIQKNILEQLLHAHNKELHLFILYTAKELPDFATAKEKLGLILNKLKLQVNEKNTPGA